MFIKLKNNKNISIQIKGDGEPIFFIHSYLWDKNMWNPQVQELSKKYKCITIDLWGHGESDFLDEEEECSLSTLTDNIIEIADILNIDKFNYIGLSVGAMLGTYLGLNYDERIKKMVLLDGYSGAESIETKNGYFEMLKIIKELGYIPKNLIDIITPMFFSKAENEIKGQLYQYFSQKLMVEKTTNINTVVKLGEAIFGRENLLEDMDKIKVPILFMVGEEDIPRPIFESQKMNVLVKGSKLVIIPKAGHISSLENPNFVTEQIFDFLKNLKN